MKPSLSTKERKALEKMKSVLSTVAPVDEPPKPTGHERMELAKLRRAGTRLVSPKFRGVTLQKLVAKGYVREIPGLIDGCPQGFVAVE